MANLRASATAAILGLSLFGLAPHAYSDHCETIKTWQECEGAHVRHHWCGWTREGECKYVGILLYKKEDIIATQKRLNEEGIAVGVDGVFGGETKKAIEDFQLKNGIPATGKIDKLTTEMLFKH